MGHSVEHTRLEKEWVLSFHDIQNLEKNILTSIMSFASVTMASYIGFSGSNIRRNQKSQKLRCS